MQTVLNRGGRLTIVLMLVLATGGHWAFLQSVAWFGMAVRFTQSEPLAAALEKTFNGQNPCTLCKTVEEGVKTEKEHKAQKLEAKLELFCPAAAFVFDAPAPTLPPALAEISAAGRLETPPVPPPRIA